MLLPETTICVEAQGCGFLAEELLADRVALNAMILAGSIGDRADLMSAEENQAINLRIADGQIRKRCSSCPLGKIVSSIVKS